ncbi:hypothetical protein F3Y22_tig00116959pilonHSYRG00493 [Hibiscus syriacus]|uniref:Uncharacterized protein n=1 Tax=Hibiscus syriacus TaxID=106335 RepID=A0A6A2XNT2_HIBSY|nr:hypothetical protein F3Y22_tig00116959pilonHSYRG00493 [Hibiscus syriacus]
MDVRAARLLERLKTEKNVLIILDDVWENLELGVPTTDEHKGCKILMMSRSLELSNPYKANFKGIPEKAYSAIEMSYKFLENEELQPIFLLCSIMGHDAAIEDLLRYARGLGLLHGVKRVKDTRDKVLSLVNILKASCLLLDGSHPTRSDMHDVVRDVAISIASRDYGWLVLTKEDVYEEWSDEGTMRKCELVSLRSAKVSELPDGLECPVLTFFSMHDLIDCKRLEVIAPDFLSSLSSLEELYLYGSFDRWEVEGIDNPRSNASLVELQCLSHLNTLEVQIRDVQAMPKDDMFFGKLERYKIFIGDLMWYELYDGLQMNTSRILQVKMKKSINLYGGITLLLRNVRSHWLEEVEDVRKMLYDPITEGFLDLKHLRFRYVLDIKVLLSSMMLVPCFESLSLSGLTDLEAICDRQLKVGSFDRLRIIKVESCNALKNLFFFPIATKFCQLEEIIVSNCHNMIGLIVEEEKMVTGLWMSALGVVGLALNLRAHDFVSQEIRAAEDLDFKTVYTKNIVLNDGSCPALENLSSLLKKRSKRSQIRVGAMAADEGKVKIEKFDGADFGFWKMQIEDFLYQKNLYQPLLGKQPEGMKNEDWALLDRQALGVIRLTLSRNVAFNIAKEKTTASLMVALSNSWNATVTAVSSSSGNNKLKFDDVRDLESANVTEETGDAMILSVNSLIESWILDSWASFHSTPCQEIMENYVSGDFGKVHLADDETLKIVGKGDIRLKLPNQTTWKLTGLRHIFGLKRNLIYVGQLDGEGYSTTFSGCEWKITKGALVIARGKKTGTLYGPSPVPSLAGSLYYVIFIDDSTRKVWVYFLKKKSEVFDTFRKWKAMVENETGLKVKRLSPTNVSLLVMVVMSCYRFWDYENQKIIRSRDVIFNENVMYKDRSTIESSSSNIEAETKEFAEFEEISRNDVQISPEAVQEEPDTPELRRSSRIPKPTQRYSPCLHYLLLTDNGEPDCYDEVMQVEDSVKWKSSMKDEMDSLMSNQTWELAELPPGKKALHNKWIYRIKEEHDGSKRYKRDWLSKVFNKKKILLKQWELLAGGDTILTGYVDTDLARNIDIRRSTTGYVYTLGGTTVSWVSQLQKLVALSTTEVEYVAVTEASKEMVWLQSFLEELGKKQENNVLYCDSQSAIHLAKNPSFHSRTSTYN